MSAQKKKHTAEKTQLHPRNKHRGRYDFKQLIESYPGLAPFVKLNPYQDPSIDFFDPEAVKMLNKALLKHYYDINDWDIPQNYLCPPIPGRADYIHSLADILSGFGETLPTGEQIKCLDIGVGANCIYPIIGNKEYGWSFVGADIDLIAIQSANKIIESNPALKDKIEIRFQHNPKNIFLGIIQENERFDITLCNPPFHSSLAEAQSGTQRKLKNLTGKKITKPTLNFGGQQNELWCEGGEVKFIRNMIIQSKQFATSCCWFTTLVAKQTSLSPIYYALKNACVTDIITIPMGQGNKISRIVAWTFLSPARRRE